MATTSAHSSTIKPPPRTTPLLLSIEHSQPSSAAVLLARGANPNIPNSYPPLLAAISRAAEDSSTLSIIPLLLSHGANANLVTSNSVTPISAALGNGCSAVTTHIISILLNAGASVHATGHNGLSPLEHAATFKRESVFALLLDHGATTHMHPNLIAHGMNPNTGAYAMCCAVAADMPYMVMKTEENSDGMMWIDTSVRELMIDAMRMAVLDGKWDCLVALLHVGVFADLSSEYKVRGGKLKAVRAVAELDETWKIGDARCVKKLLWLIRLTKMKIELGEEAQEWANRRRLF